MRRRDSSLSCCVRSAAQFLKTIIPPREARLDGVLESTRHVQTDVERGFGLVTQEWRSRDTLGICGGFTATSYWSSCSWWRARHWVATGWLAAASQSVSQSDCWTPLNYAVGFGIFPSPWWDYLEYLQVRHTPVVSFIRMQSR